MIGVNKNAIFKKDVDGKLILIYASSFVKFRTKSASKFIVFTIPT